MLLNKIVANFDVNVRFFAEMTSKNKFNTNYPILLSLRKEQNSQNYWEMHF